MTRATLLDTNVVSELLRPGGNPRVAEFVSNLEKPILSSIVFHELFFGLELMPIGRRKTDLSVAIEDVRRRFRDLIVPVDDAVAQIAGKLRANEALAGFEPDGMDALIAACAIASSARLATRNTKDFQRMNIDLVNPWND
jgi:predicted nucleic acid-binding protein